MYTIELLPSAARALAKLDVSVQRRLARAVDHEKAALADAVGETFAGLAIVELDEGIAQHAARLGPATLRASDAIHLASALSVAPELDAFIAYDVRLADAARAAGLDVVAPS